jgi:glycerol-3-phosphate dehydrogenase
MSTGVRQDVEIAVVGAGVVGSAVALALSRRGASVALLESELQPGTRASGSNSGVLHTGFDSVPGELETELILRAAALRETVIEALGIPMLRCGAVMRGDAERLDQLLAGAGRNGVTVNRPDEQTLEVPGEAVTDPVVYTRALAAEAERQGAELVLGFALAAVESGMRLRAQDGRALRAGVLVNCAGLFADAVARLLGDDSFAIYPRKGEFLVFDPPGGPPGKILLPVPSERTKGVIVFPTIDGKTVAGPTAIDLEDKLDWSVRPQARDEILAKAAPMYPALEGAEPVASYAGLRPAGRGVNYLIGRSSACAELINVAAIRSTGLTAAVAIAERVSGIVGQLGIELGPERDLFGGPLPELERPWWERPAA